jgi:predicted ribosome quality control (RQC) complex YloA/Tae2 family protein
LNPEAKLIVGRTERDNENILHHHDPAEDTVIKVKKFPGPIGLVPHGAKKDSIFLAASICAGYSKAPNFSSVKVQVTSPQGKEVIKVLGLPPEDVKKLMIV